MLLYFYGMYHAIHVIRKGIHHLVRDLRQSATEKALWKHPGFASMCDQIATKKISYGGFVQPLSMVDVATLRKQVDANKQNPDVDLCDTVLIILT